MDEQRQSLPPLNLGHCTSGELARIIRATSDLTEIDKRVPILDPGTAVGLGKLRPRAEAELAKHPEGSGTRTAMAAQRQRELEAGARESEFSLS
jgi:hypothetical protein